MATWDEKEQENKTCTQCGATYRVTYTKLPLRESDRFICSCGNIMHEWRETGMYSYEKISENQD